jgi:hypothetical protein
MLDVEQFVQNSNVLNFTFDQLKLKNFINSL